MIDYYINSTVVSLLVLCCILFSHIVNISRGISANPEQAQAKMDRPIINDELDNSSGSLQTTATA